jgi:hypothetical protein
MISRAWSRVVVAAGAACLVACGGGGSPTGSGTTGTGGGSGTGGGAGGDSGTGASAGTGGSTGTGIDAFEGIRCVVDGVSHEWPQAGLAGGKAMFVDLDVSGVLSFWAYPPESPPPDIRIEISDGNTPGTYACDTEGITHIWYFTADDGWTTVGPDDCSITLTGAAPAINGYWTGTFSATIPSFSAGTTTPIVVTEGSFKVRRAH